ncbi:Type 1 glutamine amidotransferase-like domain-containing protein [Planomicrobium sp. CPCC 101110]|uniref:Type 1 glutamine amidotransferase-like domain-containing protein n=1 Tax=Planomicrobium sp. CPCC 101110 TaxID=2599619 RepID=UPI0016489536|nr:Type 1 glutamine amidotransferase-like domain-containing protein [Planomicrobium sp. CPCC 101110]
MGKLFFYSDQVVESFGNQRLDHMLFDSRNTKNTKIGYIPSTEDREKTYFDIKTQYYRRYGVQDFMFFDLYSEFDSSKIDELAECDILHLSAGNPIKFRNAIEHRKMDKFLRDFFNQGGTVVGVSGGGVQLGKSIKLFQIFTGDSDNELEGLQLVDFEFLPHYNRWNEDYKEAVRSYAENTGTTVYAANDGDGILVEEGEIQIVGDIAMIDG